VQPFSIGRRRIRAELRFHFITSEQFFPGKGTDPVSRRAGTQIPYTTKLQRHIPVPIRSPKQVRMVLLILIVSRRNMKIRKDEFSTLYRSGRRSRCGVVIEFYCIRWQIEVFLQNAWNQGAVPNRVLRRLAFAQMFVQTWNLCDSSQLLALNRYGEMLL